MSNDTPASPRPIPCNPRVVLHHVLALDHCPVHMPWSRSSSGTHPMHRLHRQALDLQFPPKLRYRMFFAPVWALVSAFKALAQVHRLGEAVERRYRVSRWRQWWQMVYLANRFNIGPRYYYVYRFWEPEKRRQADLYLQKHDNIYALSWFDRGMDLDIFLDKLRFYRRCRELGLPAIPVVAAFAGDGTETWIEDRLPPQDLFLKPRVGYGGVGAECWRLVPGTRSWQRQELVLDEDAFLAYCRERARATDLVVQPRQVNHEAWVRFSNGSLSTMRVVSCRAPEVQRHAILEATLKMGTGAAEVDNLSAGGLSAAVSENGRLDVAVTGLSDLLDCDSHPDTGMPITGEVLPFFADVVALAQRAHDAFELPPFIGWDITVTAAGPMLVEGNPGWGITTVTRPISPQYAEAFWAILEHRDQARPAT